MSSLDQKEDERKEAVVHTNKILLTALGVLEDVCKGNLGRFSEFELGAKDLIRRGSRRTINYLEVDDGSGSKLRIEIFTTD
jgi:hypothetical protein